MVKSEVISNDFIEDVCTRLSENKRVRRSIPIWGRLHIDRQLPFLCIYRRLEDNDKSLSERLIIGEASYLIATGNQEQQKQLSKLIKRIVQTLKESFGSFLIFEVWLSSDEINNKELSPYQSIFKIIQPKKTSITSTIETFAKALKEIKIRKVQTRIEFVYSSRISPPGLQPLLSSAVLNQLGCHIIGVEVRPIHKNIESGQVFPFIRQELQKGFSHALKISFFEFINNHTKFHPPNFQSLGRRSMVKAVWEVDKQLAEFCNSFDFLLQVTPTNSNSAWSAFQRYQFEKKPEFTYRPIPIDPVLAKRKLFQVPIERIEDPTIAQLFREQQLELDRKLTMLIDRGTKRFFYGSLQLYGNVTDSLLKIANDLLEKINPRNRDETKGSYVNADTFASRAIDELAYFKKTFPEIQSKVVVREDIPGLMVSQGNLLIGKNLKIPSIRIEALIQHEIGTHVLTYLNGKSQPLRQLHVGLAGYDELQEGLAVLSEYMVDGLTRPRMRLLAARVVAARNMEDGASFVEVFRSLNKIHGFERRTAFTITLRTFRSGGLTKDAVYLRGFVKLLKYIREGGVMESLFIGKISADNIPIINELLWRKVLHPIPLLPSYMGLKQTTAKLKKLKNGITLLELIKRS